MSTAIQPDIVTLLGEAGAHPRGNRHDCPKCGGLRTLTHTAECFFCHKCQWAGNTITLEKELGIYQRLPSAEYRKARQQHERAHEAAQRLYAVTRQQQLTLRHILRELGRVELLAQKAGPIEAAWDALQLVYQERPRILAELGIAEHCGAADVFPYFMVDDETRARAISRVIERGGLHDANQKFIEVANT